MKKFLNVFKNIFTWIVVIVAVAMMVFTIFSVTMVDKNDRKLFGYRAFKVMSDSMSATDFSAGDLIFVREVDTHTLVEGDIISFVSMSDESYGDIITHKIRSITTTSNGNLSFETYGTTTGVSDELWVNESNVIGKYVGKIGKLGYLFNFIKTTPGYILCIFMPFMILILIQAADSIKLFKKYKKEQKRLIEKEKAEIAKERAEADKMMKELLEIKKQLAVKAQIETEASVPNDPVPMAAPIQENSEAQIQSESVADSQNIPVQQETENEYMDEQVSDASFLNFDDEPSDVTDLSSLWSD